MRTAAISLGALAAIGASEAIGATDGYGTVLNQDALPVNWFAVIYALVFVIAIAVVCFKNSKRTHLD
jgi:hypothetical protein